MKLFPSSIEETYEVKCQVGQGGLGRVFSAIHRQTGQHVAIKILNQAVQKDEDFIGMFQKEMMTLMNLEHPNLTKFIDCSFEPSNCYVITEFISGWSLRDVLQFFGRLPPLVSLSILQQIFAGIDYLHLKDLVHSDLSAANIMVRNDGTVLVTDLGLASDMQGHGYRGELVGTPGYYSPEHVSEDAVCQQSDLYSTGLLLFEMVTGKKAIFYGRSIDHLKEIHASMRDIPFKQVKTTDKHLTLFLKRTLHCLLRFKRANRISTAEEAIDIVGKILNTYRIGDQRAAVQQFLKDGRLVSKSEPTVGASQNIYFGNPPYTLDDLAILRKSS